MTMSDIANSAKITLIWRGVLTLLSVLVVAGVGLIITMMSSIIDKINSTASDVALIKFELPVIKENARKDKEYLLNQMQNGENRQQDHRRITDENTKRISSMEITIAVLKQKLQIP